MVQCNDKEAADYCYGLSKKQKDQERAWILGEHRNMKRGDRESKTYMSIDDMHEQLRSYRQQELRVEVPPAALVGALDEGRPRDPLVLQPQEPPRVVQRGNHHEPAPATDLRVEELAMSTEVPRKRVLNKKDGSVGDRPVQKSEFI